MAEYQCPQDVNYHVVSIQFSPYFVHLQSLNASPTCTSLMKQEPHANGRASLALHLCYSMSLQPSYLEAAIHFPLASRSGFSMSLYHHPVSLPRWGSHLEVHLVQKEADFQKVFRAAVGELIVPSFRRPWRAGLPSEHRTSCHRDTSPKRSRQSRRLVWW